jgi:hypothetical protein
MVRLSGCDFASAIKMSAADAACAKLTIKAMQTAKRRAFKIAIVQSPQGRSFVPLNDDSDEADWRL